jgi:hypothetical protein
LFFALLSPLNGLSLIRRERRGTQWHFGCALDQDEMAALPTKSRRYRVIAANTSLIPAGRYGYAQQPRQMFPMARSTAASSGVGLSMASGTEGTSADVG